MLACAATTLATFGLLAGRQHARVRRLLQHVAAAANTSQHSSLGGEVVVDLAKLADKAYAADAASRLKRLLAERAVVSIRLHSGDERVPAVLEAEEFQRVCATLVPGELKRFVGQDSDGCAVRYDQDVQVRPIYRNGRRPAAF
jgi:hypothetical protein